MSASKAAKARGKIVGGGISHEVLPKHGTNRHTPKAKREGAKPRSGTQVVIDNESFLLVGEAQGAAKGKIMQKNAGRPTQRIERMASIEEVARAHGTGFAAVHGRVHLKTGASAAPVIIELPNYDESENALAEKLVRSVADDNPDVNTLCETYQLKREELGRLTGFSLRALAEWASGKLPSQPAKRRLHEVRRLLDALAEIVEVKIIPQWLHKANPAFDRLTPLQVIELGEIDRLWAMVYALGSGQPD